MSTKAHATRLAFLINEDFSGDISIEELQKTLIAFSQPTEKSTIIEQEGGTLTYENHALIKIYQLMKRRSIEPHELFSAIDTDNSM